MNEPKILELARRIQAGELDRRDPPQELVWAGILIMRSLSYRPALNEDILDWMTEGFVTKRMRAACLEHSWSSRDGVGEWQRCTTRFAEGLHPIGFGERMTILGLWHEPRYGEAFAEERSDLDGCPAWALRMGSHRNDYYPNNGDEYCRYVLAATADSRLVPCSNDPAGLGYYFV